MMDANHVINVCVKSKYNKLSIKIENRIKWPRSECTGVYFDLWLRGNENFIGKPHTRPTTMYSGGNWKETSP